MAVIAPIRSLDVDEASAVVEAGGAFIDMRPLDAYLDVHIRGSLELLYESGPGFASRARDCLPLDLHLVLLDDGVVDPLAAAAALRGKGFEVVGQLHDGVNKWSRRKGAPASTDVFDAATETARVLHVGDPGAVPPPGAISIPIESLYERFGELGSPGPIAVVAGAGVRAALGIGILERHGFEPVLLKTAR